MIVKWLGHASFLIKVSGKNFYVDPYDGEYLEKADVILITHSHGDHCDGEKIKAVRKPDTLIITSIDCARGLKGKVVSMSPGDIRDIHGVTVEAVEAYNYKRFRSPGNPFHPKGTQIGFIISADEKRVYHAGDTDFIPEMKRLRIKNLDLALLPSGGTYTMDTPEAVEAALAIKPKMAIPMHCWDTNPKEFQKAVETTSQIKVVILKPGQHITLQ